MLRLVAAIAAAALLVPGAAGPARLGGSEEAYVAVEDEDVVVAVALDTAPGRDDMPKVMARIPVPNGPHNVTVTGDGRFVLVTSPPAGKVTLIDAFRRRVVKIFGGFGSPHDVETEGARYAYVTDEGRGELVVLDLKRRTVAARTAVGPRPHDVGVGDIALVTHDAGHPELTLVDVRRPRAPRVIGRLAAGGATHDIAEQPDSANAYVTYWGSGAVGAVDWGRRRLLWKRTVGSLIHHVAFDYYSGRRLWVTDHRTGVVLSLSSRNGRVLRRLRDCPGAHHVHFGPGRGHVVAACHDSGTLLILDPVQERAVRVRVGSGPHGVAVAFVP